MTTRSERRARANINRNKELTSIVLHLIEFDADAGEQVGYVFAGVAEFVARLVEGSLDTQKDGMLFADLPLRHRVYQLGVGEDEAAPPCSGEATHLEEANVGTAVKLGLSCSDGKPRKVGQK